MNKKTVSNELGKEFLVLRSEDRLYIEIDNNNQDEGIIEKYSSTTVY